MRACGKELVTTDESAIISKLFLDEVMVKDGQGN